MITPDQVIDPACMKVLCTVPFAISFFVFMCAFGDFPSVVLNISRETCGGIYLSSSSVNMELNHGLINELTVDDVPTTKHKSASSTSLSIVER